MARGQIAPQTLNPIAPMPLNPIIHKASPPACDDLSACNAQAEGRQVKG